MYKYIAISLLAIGLAHDAEGFLAENTNRIYLCEPNNSHQEVVYRSKNGIEFGKLEMGRTKRPFVRSDGVLELLDAKISNNWTDTKAVVPIYSCVKDGIFGWLYIMDEQVLILNKNYNQQALVDIGDGYVKNAVYSDETKEFCIAYQTVSGDTVLLIVGGDSSLYALQGKISTQIYFDTDSLVVISKSAGLVKIDRHGGGRKLIMADEHDAIESIEFASDIVVVESQEGETDRRFSLVKLYKLQTNDGVLDVFRDVCRGTICDRYDKWVLVASEDGMLLAVDTVIGAIYEVDNIDGYDINTSSLYIDSVELTNRRAKIIINHMQRNARSQHSRLIEIPADN